MGLAQISLEDGERARAGLESDFGLKKLIPRPRELGVRTYKSSSFHNPQSPTRTTLHRRHLPSGIAAADAMAAAFKHTGDAAEVGTTTGCAAAAVAGPRRVKLPMPQATIGFILAWRKGPSPNLEEMDDSEFLSPEHRRQREELHAYLDKLDLEFDEFQDEVRREVQETGGYLQTFDEAAHAETEKVVAQAREEWVGIDWAALHRL